jgi:hypothetical protein
MATPPPAERFMIHAEFFRKVEPIIYYPCQKKSSLILKKISRPDWSFFLLLYHFAWVSLLLPALLYSAGSLPELSEGSSPACSVILR